MKRSVLIVLALMLTASMAFAQNGSVMVFSDEGASDCNFVDAGGIVQVYVFHMYAPGVIASEWMLDVTQVGWTHLGDINDFTLTLGTSVAGIAFSYEQCLVGNFRLQTVNFIGTAAETCSLIGIVAHPDNATVRSVNCAQGDMIIPGGQGRVNPDGTCSCAVPVQETTWGTIKALYN